MTVKEEEDGEKFTYMEGFRLILVDDDRPERSEVEIEQREDESYEEYHARIESEIRGENYDLYYLHDESGWVKCVATTESSQPDKQWNTEKFWYPPHRIETIV